MPRLYDDDYRSERRKSNIDEIRDRYDNRNGRYSGDIFDSGRAGYRNDRYNDRSDYDEELYSRWIDNDHGRASWGSNDYGWRSDNDEADNYRSRSERSYGRSSGRMYTGRYGNAERDDDDFKGGNRYSRRESRGAYDEDSDYGTGFNEYRNERYRSGLPGNEYFDDREFNRNRRYDDDYRRSYRNRY